MSPPFRTQRPRLSLPLLAYALADVVGLVLISLGGTWFISGRPLFFSGFPTSTFQAILCMAVGLGVMFWAVAKLLLTMAAQHRRDDDEKDS